MKKIFACIYFWKVLNEEKEIKRDVKLLFLWKHVLFSNIFMFFLVILLVGVISGDKLPSPAPIIFIAFLFITHFIAQFASGFTAVLKADEAVDKIKREQRKNQPEMTWKEAWEKDKKEMKKGMFLLDKGILLFILAFIGFGITLYSISQIASSYSEYSIGTSLITALIGIVLTIPFVRIWIALEKEDEDTLESMSNTYWKRDRNVFKKIKWASLVSKFFNPDR